MNYRSISDMNQTILKNLHKVPEDVQVVVGIPRSGLLVALMLGLHRNLIVTDLDGLIARRAISKGTVTLSDVRNSRDYLTTKRKILVIDDSYSTGSTLQKARRSLEEAELPHEILYGVVYGGLKAKGNVDIVFERLLKPHIFEWNLSRNAILPYSCVDMDGVLCRNPMPLEDDDSRRYMNFLENAEPLWRPDRKLGWIVTSRLEKYRTLTENWLRDHNVEYKQLYMLDVESQHARRRVSVPGYKASVFRSVDADLFMESSFVEAIEIASLTKGNVLCFENSRLIQASRCEELRSQLRKPANLLRPLFLYAGYLFRKFPEEHIIVGPIKRSGRYFFRRLQQWQRQH
ncbi:MAG: phosphoribosyltransferase [Deltaproteobacteria bacterium]|nr:phosphoribosyltransferase [Deltaproteobacteria bacterium]